MAYPVLYSFRRCPYAMRARLAIAVSGKRVELREIVLRDKPRAMLEASPKGTVPVLVTEDRTVLEESRDIMDWALSGSDPEGWLDFSSGIRAEIYGLADCFDGPFKQALDRYKYASRHAGTDAGEEREKAATILREVGGRLKDGTWLFGNRFSYGDAAILPFVRQYAFTDIEWFRAQDWPLVTGWLDRFLGLPLFDQVMEKYPVWQEGGEGEVFPPPIPVS